MQLTQKETMLIADLKNEEQLCADKYAKHASCACDPQLKNLFSQISQVERGHLTSLEELEKGRVPSPSSSGGSSSLSQMTFNPYYSGECTEKSADMYLCSDVLMTEKHASDLYNTCVFEFKDQGARDLLNHIQKEEQEHGKLIYDYMQTNNMYS